MALKTSGHTDSSLSSSQYMVQCTIALVGVSHVTGTTYDCICTFQSLLPLIICDVSYREVKEQPLVTKPLRIVVTV